MKDFSIYHASSVDDAVRVLRKSNGTAKLMSGGTDLLGSLKRDIYPFAPKRLVSLKDIASLRYIREETDGLHIGAMSTLTEVSQAPQVKQQYPALAQAAGHTASPQLRNQGTIAGNICQEIRCWYLRATDDYFDCLKKGGNFCYAINGDNRYHSIFGGIRVHGMGLPCREKCPSHIDIPDYIQLIKNNDMEGAAGKLLENNPLGAMTGRVCPHFCETKCNRKAVDDAVSIREIERMVGDYIIDHPNTMACTKLETGHHIAIIGGGPAGLTAGFYLRRLGHAVTIYEANPEAGGMLMYAIPGYRLPKKIVRKLIKAFQSAGIKFVTNCRVGQDVDFGEIKQKHDAVLCTCGTTKERKSGIEGDQCISSGLHFLKDINMGSSMPAGKNVAVLGGGNTAMDVARTLRRQGAEVTVIYRRTIDEMPAIREDVERAMEEGVQFLYLTQPKLARKEGQICLRCVKMVLGERDDSGRPRPVEVADSDFDLFFDAIYTAFGETADAGFLPDDNKDHKGYFQSSSGIYGAGDFVNGASTVTQAMASGKQAAWDIHAYLTRSDYKRSADQNRLNLSQNKVFPCERQHGDKLSVGERCLESQDEKGFTYEHLCLETKRCLNCGCVAVNPSDIAPALVVLKAEILTNKRRIPADGFWTSNVPGSTVLESDEIVTEVFIPRPAAGSRSAFVKIAERDSIDFPVANCAVNCDKDGVRICLNAVYPKPYRAYSAEEILQGKELNRDTITAAGQALAADALPLSGNGYKVDISVGLLCQALEACSKQPE